MPELVQSRWRRTQIWLHGWAVLNVFEADVRAKYGDVTRVADRQAAASLPCIFTSLEIAFTGSAPNKLSGTQRLGSCGTWPRTHVANIGEHTDSPSWSASDWACEVRLPDSHFQGLYVNANVGVRR